MTRFIRAELMVRVIALSWARLPARITTDPSGSSNSPIRLSVMSE